MCTSKPKIQAAPPPPPPPPPPPEAPPAPPKIGGPKTGDGLNAKRRGLRALQIQPVPGALGGPSGAVIPS